MLSNRIVLVENEIDSMNLFKEVLHMNGYKDVSTFAKLKSIKLPW